MGCSQSTARPNTLQDVEIASNISYNTSTQVVTAPSTSTSSNNNNSNNNNNSVSNSDLNHERNFSLGLSHSSGETAVVDDVKYYEIDEELNLNFDCFDIKALSSKMANLVADNLAGVIVGLLHRKKILWAGDKDMAVMEEVVGTSTMVAETSKIVNGQTLKLLKR